jgi:decaprenyl-phosphate phosphoribosyltransferase
MLRPHQWVKNLFVLAPAVFAKELLIREVVERALGAFVAFCCAASAVYILNDLVDRRADRVHPIKRTRPIASGAVKPALAISIGVGLMACSLGIAVALDTALLLYTVAYLVLNIAYSVRLKKVAYLDALCIATGFELRVLAGAAAVEVRPSMYLLLVTFILALFLAIGKRAHELEQGKKALQQRQSLRGYDPSVVRGWLYVTAGATVFVYAAYALDPSTQLFFQTRYLYLTTFFVAFGVVRFIVLIRHKNTADSPTEKMLTDIPFIANVALWCAAIFLLIY